MRLSALSTFLAIAMLAAPEGSAHGAAPFCYLKGNVQLAACDTEHGVDTWTSTDSRTAARGGGGNGGGGGGGGGWTQHANTYCFKGHGATDLSPNLGADATLAACEAACLKMPNCTAVCVPAAPPTPETNYTDVFGSSAQICTGAQMVASCPAPLLSPSLPPT